MSDCLVITASLISARFHGRGQDGKIEWPPSPFRLYQALVAGAAHTTTIDEARPTLLWLEEQGVKSVLTPPAFKGQEVTTYVLTNQRDKSIGSKKTEAELKSAKILKPMILSNSDELDIFYVFNWEAPKEHLQTLKKIASGVSHFGHGIDAAVVLADNVSHEKIEALRGEEWLRSNTVGNSLSVPYKGALAALERSYQSWRAQASQIHNRLSLPPIPVPRLAFQNYRHEEHPVPPAHRLFILCAEDGASLALPDTCNTHLAGMIRHLTTEPSFASILGWESTEMAMLHGHAEARGEAPKVAEERFGFVGLPTLRWAGKEIGWRVDDCRRVLLTAPAQYSERLDELVLRLHHRNLQPLGGSPPIRLVSVALDSTAERYVQSASRWSTVTPLVLPNPLGSSKDRRRLRDPRRSVEARQNILEKLDRRIDAMIRNAIVNAGISRALAQAARIRWNRSGFWPGVSRAKEHAVTKHLENRPRFHVEIEWFTRSGAPLKVSGPLLLGAGAHVGLGLFAPLPEELKRDSQ